MAQETNIPGLFRVIHTEIERVMGEINFMIAIYDKAKNLIEMPYACEDGEMLDIQPFPLGEGLTSILIETGQPLCIDENVEHRAREGAKLSEPMKSWLECHYCVRRTNWCYDCARSHQERRFSDGDQRFKHSRWASIIAIRISSY
jgi:hypothetical protein